METIIYKLYFIVGNYMKAYFKNIELVFGSDLTWYCKCPPVRKCYICMVNNVPCIDYCNSVCRFNPMQRKETCGNSCFQKKMYSLCKDYEEQDHKNNKNMEWLDSYLNLERMLRSLKTLIDDLKKEKGLYCLCWSLPQRI